MSFVLMCLSVCSWRWCKKVSDTSLVFLSGVASLKKKKRKEITPRFTTHSDRLASLIEREKIV